MSFNDRKHCGLLQLTGSISGHITDLENLLLKSNVATPPSQLNDMWHTYWDGEFIPKGHFNDRAQTWLDMIGYGRGSLSDSWYAFWTAACDGDIGLFPIHAVIGWTDGVECVGGSVVVRFSKPATFTEATLPNGVVITHDNGGAFAITSTVGSGTNIVTYEGDWDIEPVEGDIVLWDYDGTGDYQDHSGNVVPSSPNFANSEWNNENDWLIDDGLGIASLDVGGAIGNLGLLPEYTEDGDYTVQFEVFDYVTGSVRAQSDTNGVTRTANGIYEDIITIAGGQANFRSLILPTDLKLRNVSVLSSAPLDMEAQTLQLINCLDIPSAIGFLPFGSNDRSVLYYDNLRQPNSNIIHTGNTDVFTPDGVNLWNGGAHDTGIYFDLEAMGIDWESLVGGSTLTFWIDRGYFSTRGPSDGDIVPEIVNGTQTSVSFGTTATLDKIVLNTRQDLYLDIFARNADDTSTPALFESRFNISPEGKETFVRVDICVNESIIQIYIDYLLASTAPNNNPRNALFKNVNFGFKHVNVSGASTAYIIKDFMLSKRMVDQPASEGLENVLMFGDSMPQRGDYPYGRADTGNLSLFAMTRSGQQVDFRDAGTFSEIQRLLAQDDRFVGVHDEIGQNGPISTNSILGYSAGGSGITHPVNSILETDVTRAVITDGEVPSLCIIWIGSNDVTSGALGSPDAILDEVWKEVYRTQIQRLIDAGATKVVLGTVADLNSTTYYDTHKVFYQDRIHTINGLIKELAVDIAEVEIADIWLEWGGDTPNDDYYAPAEDDRHPNSLGSVVAGQIIFEKI